MRIHFILWLGLITGNALYGQSIQPDVLGSSGAHHLGPNAMLSETTGEAIVETVSGPNALLTQGFHQPKVIIDAVAAPLRSHARIYPNPSNARFWVEFEETEILDDVQYAILDLHGRAVISWKHIPPLRKFEIDLSAVSDGVYLLKLTGSSTRLPGIYKIEKTN